MKKIILIMTIATLGLAGCTKSRPAKFPYGSGENLLAKSDYDGQSFVITTKQPLLGTQKNFTKAKDVSIKAKALGSDSFSIVNYEVDTPLAKRLLGSTVLVGRPNFKYSGLIRLTEHYLKVYKVAKPEDVPLNESTFAEKLSDGRLAVPIIGYPVSSLVSIERARNELNEKTSNLSERNQRENLGAATHFRIDMTRPEIFEAVAKTDVLPISYFSGEWYYSEMVIAASEEDSTNIGMGDATDQSLKPSNRVKFLTSENALRVVNLNIDSRLVEKEDTNFKTTMNIPIALKAYKVSANGKGMSEVEDGDIHWSKKSLVQLNLGGAQTVLNSGSSQLAALEIEDDYFSFAVQDKSNTRIKYSFLRISKKNGYVARRYFKEDRKIFGFFDTVKSTVQNFEIARQEDIEKNTFISRFNPKSKKIVYHFTKTTPQWVRPSVVKVVQHWSDAFAKAGTGMEVVLDPSFDVELGDIRYNTINIIETLTPSDLFGFGPSITDPMSGEIISATTNVHVTPIREAIIDEIRNFVEMKLGRFDKSMVAGITSQVRALENLSLKEGDGKLSVLSDTISIAGNVKMYLPDAKTNKLALTTVDFRNRDPKNPREFDIALVSGNIHQDIQQQCPEVMTYIDSLKSSNSSYSDQEHNVLNVCSRKLVLGKMMGTLTHEMGHNLGLRHNFMGSNDLQNFWRAEETQTKSQVRSSSVMEYPSFNEDRLVTPGKYDIAAIRFGYADSVELKNGQITRLDINRSINQNMEQKSASLKTFKYCTDEDVWYSVDPMCRRHDAGVTPAEVVKNIVNEYSASYQTVNFRRDKLRTPSPERLILYRYATTFAPLQRFYEEWRLGIARYLGEDEQYLERLSKEDFDSVIKKMAADPKQAEFIKQYQPAAEQIFKFAYTLLNTPNRFCLYTNQSGEPNLIELEQVREVLFFKQNKSVTSCAQGQDYFTENKFQYITEFGYYTESFRYNLSPEVASEPLDVIGTTYDRYLALALISERASSSYTGRTKGFAPTMLDEPSIREKMSQYMMYRTMVGISGASILPLISQDPLVSKDLKEKIKETSFAKFSKESDFIGEVVRSVLSGIKIKGKSVASLQRLQPFMGTIVRQFTPDYQEMAVDSVSVPGVGTFFVDSAANKSAISLIKAYRQVQTIRTVKLFDLADPESVALLNLTKQVFSDPKISNMTAGELRQHVDGLMQKLSELQKDGAKLMKMSALIRTIEKVLSPVVANQNATENGSDDEKKKAQNWMNLNSLKALQLYYGPSFKMLTAEDIDKSIALNNKLASRYSESRAEYDAQNDLLTNFLLYANSLQ